VTERLLAELDDRMAAAAEEVRAGGEARIASELDRMRTETAAALAEVKASAAVASNEVERSGQLAGANARKAAARIERQSRKLRRRARRQELRLIKRERSRQITAAVETVESRAAEVSDELARVAASAQAGTRRSGIAADERIATALAAVKGSLEMMRESERRAMEAEERIAAMERSIGELVESLGTTIGWTERLGAARRAEEEAAARISDAETRLRRLLGDAE
jgi:hypothetical protein